jgi:hypothetical protein
LRANGAASSTSATEEAVADFSNREGPDMFSDRVRQRGDHRAPNDHGDVVRQIFELFVSCQKRHALGSSIRELRNDVAHNEPTPDLMNKARTCMQAAALWSTTDTFLNQPCRIVPSRRTSRFFCRVVYKLLHHGSNPCIRAPKVSGHTAGWRFFRWHSSV